MRALVFTAISLITLSIATSVVLAQGNDPSIAAKHAIGEVKSVDAATKQVQIELTQVQTGGAYRLPLEIALGNGGQPSRIEKFELTTATGRFSFPADTEPTSVTLDPNTWVLMQVEEFVKR